MRKKEYQKPKVNIIKLQHQKHILSGSTFNSNADVEYVGSDQSVPDDDAFAR